ncbi:NTP transferase domain-containing protein [Paenibacillus sp. SYP-B3998]|uniref:NTP transferase domain-containing protein n=1 Tax=Paenibacillus sp. SYP-B3998 TaxID=2678564 RepID=A0A6G4A379_9BACL|nr:nucleotidyltransferase family protein [Paenibacillus sp. SYP-B3998]NEW08842.1 NTP transferase domain-containing protein [Paenibacillus sp. SYP-B3998]
MTRWRDILIGPHVTIMQTMKLIDDTRLQFALVVDEDRRILGTVTDGDIRRGLLKGLSLDTSIHKVMNESPIYEKSGKKPFYYKEFMRKQKLKQLPIVNQERQIQDVLFADNVVQISQKENTVILMVGGLGTRLRPLTDHMPKPMLKVGDKPILESIINSFKGFGFTNFILSVNYKKDIIKDYFQDGTQLDVNISYIEETKRLGTAGALSLLVEKPDHPFFVMNGDLLTKINYEQLLSFHNETNSVATMCVREYEYQIPYGVLETENHRLLSIEEKPIHKSFVNAGIYVLNPDVLKLVPQNEFYDMPDLFKKMMSEQQEVSAFPLREYWLDIGRMDDYEKANFEFSGGFL